jgi:carboxypeptidase C (cathepsin A)
MTDRHMTKPDRRLFVAAAASALAFALTVPSFGQSPRRPPSTDAKPAEQQSEARRLPADSTTEHTLELPGRTLRFKATAGTIPLNDASDGKLLAEIAYVAYVQPDAQPANRTLTFVFNGGPGAASAYMQLGALGPWRLPLAGATPSSPPVTVPNAETWLDFTDLVFVDPVGTGYSHFASSSDDVRKRFWSVDGDIEALSTFVRKWIEKASRQASVKFIAGESYGGFRAPKLARQLAKDGIGVTGLVMVSPVLDFGWRGNGRHVPNAWIARLPSMAAAARELSAPFDRAALREAERYAAGEYLQDLMRGERDAAAVERMTARVAALTKLDPALVRRLAARVDTRTFLRELNRERSQIASNYDATVTGIDPSPNATESHYDDPVLSAITAPLTSAMTDLYGRVLNWRVEDPYRLLNGQVSSRWDWGGGRGSNEIVSDIRSALAAEPRLRVLITHGASDLVTPYFENQLIIDQMPAFATPERLTLTVYGGGHMYYNRDASRRALREDAERLYRAVAESFEKPRG